MGRAATEISLQLLGGGRRLNPSNSHQAPVIVAICGNGRYVLSNLWVLLCFIKLYFNIFLVKKFTILLDQAATPWMQPDN